MAQTKDFYDYQMAVDYVTAKEKGDKKKIVELQHKTYNQYINLAHKMKWDLVKRLEKTYLTTEQIFDITDSYESDIYSELVKAMDSIKIEKIPAKTNSQGKRTWTFYAAYWGYLMTYNRDFTKKLIEQVKNETLTDYNQPGGGSSEHNGDANNYLNQNKAALIVDELVASSPEKIYEEQNEKKIFWKAVDNCLNKRFNATQVKIWNTRAKFVDEKHKSVATICKDLNISPKEYHREMRATKELFDTEIKNLSNVY